MNKFDIIIENIDSTVVSSYKSKRVRQTEYQSEADLENVLMKQLKNQGYEYLNAKTPKELILNLRIQLEKLNNYTFSDKEWNQILNNYLVNPKESIVEKTRKIQEDYIYSLTKDDGTTQNIRILDKSNIHNNSLQVINQFEVEGLRKNRYDVTILVNGLPLVHIELKRRGVTLKEAFNQIRRYHHESFWAESGLYEYAQIYVISNGTQTKYYSNTTRERANSENISKDSAKQKTSNSFEFTSYWADARNKTIDDLEDFAATFLTKHTLLNVIIKYCVFTADNLLLVMRPYQIVAAEKIINQININLNNKKQIGTIDAGGYIWHTTGSGKTLTSFKAARIAADNEDIKKVLFVVDRKDLDYQTMREYDKFEEGAANSNTSTAVLKKQLEDPNSKIIITTIQKLSIFIKQNKKHNIYNDNIVLIFDECHRSQFGDMHRDIVKAFKKYMIFGFTGTPIFASNTTSGNKFPTMKTTEQVFGKQLHTYTIVDAIRDGNVLPFRIDYINTARAKDELLDEEVYDIEREKALLAPNRISEITKYILEHFYQKTKRNERSYEYSKITNIKEVARRRNKAEEIKEKTIITGFNSLFAVASIEAAKRYYTEFKKQQEDLIPDKQIKVAIIYSWNPNEGNEFEEDGLFDENNENTDRLDKPSRDFLDEAIKDYNNYFGTSYDTSSDKFQNYYKDLSLRVKNREVDLLIVVNMFLTGFDATTLNTLWIDKRLRQHGLIQAFSRTNRILNSIKTFGNIVCFRNLENQVNEAIGTFGNPDAKGIVLLKSFKDYYEGHDDFPGYLNLVTKLVDEYPIGEVILGETNEKNFIKLYNQILKVNLSIKNIGNIAGKKALILYLEKPNNKLEGPKYSIIDFYKSVLLKPNETENIEIEIDLSISSAFDEKGAILKNHYLYEKGNYTLYLGKDLHDNDESVSFKLTEDLIFNEGKLIPLEKEFTTINNEKVQEVAFIEENISNEKYLYKENSYTFKDINEVGVDKFIEGLTDEDLTHLIKGEGMSSPKGTPGIAAVVGGLTERLKEKEIPIIGFADGPSGIRMDSGFYASSLPNGALLASTFNLPLIEKLYTYVGYEMDNYNILVLLGPGMNIYRSPLCGRNFEYFSEDPLITGLIASAVIKELHNANKYGSLKHLMLNNQENRRFENEVWASNRAIREIYLRPFEIAIKKANAQVIMSSYNYINGYHSLSHPTLFKLIREEFDFKGIFISDWWAHVNNIYEELCKSKLSKMVKANHDLYMVVENTITHENDLLEALKNKEITRGELVSLAKNILMFIHDSKKTNRDKKAIPKLKYPHLINEVDVDEFNNLTENVLMENGNHIYYIKKVIPNTKIELPELELIKVENVHYIGEQITGEKGLIKHYKLEVFEDGKYGFNLKLKNEGEELSQLSINIYFNGIYEQTYTYGYFKDILQASIFKLLKKGVVTFSIEFRQKGLVVESIYIFKHP